MKEISFPARQLSDYIKMWFTEAKAEWETYKNCCTKWQSLQETGSLADDSFDGCKKWTSRLMAYEEWADTNTQPAEPDTIELTIYEPETQEAVEWLLSRLYLYPSAEAYLAHYWTGIQGRSL